MWWSFGRSWTVAVCNLWCTEVLANEESMLQMWAAAQCSPRSSTYLDTHGAVSGMPHGFPSSSYFWWRCLPRPFLVSGTWFSTSGPLGRGPPPEGSQTPPTSRRGPNVSGACTGSVRFDEGPLNPLPPLRQHNLLFSSSLDHLPVVVPFSLLARLLNPWGWGSVGSNSRVAEESFCGSRAGRCGMVSMGCSVRSPRRSWSSGTRLLEPSAEVVFHSGGFAPERAQSAVQDGAFLGVRPLQGCPGFGVSRRRPGAAILGLLLSVLGCGRVGDRCASLIGCTRSWSLVRRLIGFMRCWSVLGRLICRSQCWKVSLVFQRQGICWAVSARRKSSTR